MSGLPGDLRAAEWEVREVDLVTCQAFVLDLHYSGGGANTGVGLHGLFRRGDDRCLGIAWWLPPTPKAARATHPEPDRWREVLSLSRLALDPAAPRNAASFLLSRSRRMLDPTWSCLVTYADEWQGHSGAIYRADNWEYVGKTRPTRIYVRGGRMIATKSANRTRTHAEMLALGCECLGAFAKSKFRKLR